MKAKIKQFFEKEGERILFYTVGFAAGALAIIILDKKEMAGKEVCCAKLTSGENSSLVQVFLKNDKMHVFEFPNE